MRACSVNHLSLSAGEWSLSLPELRSFWPASRVESSSSSSGESGEFSSILAILASVLMCCASVIQEIVNFNQLSRNTCSEIFVLMVRR